MRPMSDIPTNDVKPGMLAIATHCGQRRCTKSPRGGAHACLTNNVGYYNIPLDGDCRIVQHMPTETGGNTTNDSINQPPRNPQLDHAEFCVAQAQGQGLPCVAAHDELIWLRAARETRLFMSQINN